MPSHAHKLEYIATGYLISPMRFSAEQDKRRFLTIGQKLKPVNTQNIITIIGYYKLNYNVVQNITPMN